MPQRLAKPWVGGHHCAAKFLAGVQNTVIAGAILHGEVAAPVGRAMASMTPLAFIGGQIVGCFEPQVIALTPRATWLSMISRRGGGMAELPWLTQAIARIVISEELASNPSRDCVR